MTRRSQASGSVTYLDGGKRARLRVYVGTNPDGSPRQVSRTIKVESRREVNRQLDALKAEVAMGDHGGTNSTLRRVMEDYIAEMPRLERSPRTIAEAQRFLANVLPAELLDKQARTITPDDLSRFYGAIHQRSPRSLPRYHAVLRAALNRAVRHDVIVRNPADRVTMGELPERPKEALPTYEQVCALIKEVTVRNPAMGVLVYLAAVTGMRRGELAALRWSDLDFDAGQIVVSRALYKIGPEVGEKAPKSRRSRIVVLDAQPAALLQLWRDACEATAIEAGSRLTVTSYVFSSFPDGSRPLNPDSVSDAVVRVGARLGVKVHLHQLRHAAATELLDKGIPVNDVAAMLGHADPAFTMRVYGHASNKRQAQAAAVLGALTPPALAPGK